MNRRIFVRESRIKFSGASYFIVVFLLALFCGVALIQTSNAADLDSVVNESLQKQRDAIQEFHLRNAEKNRQASIMEKRITEERKQISVGCRGDKECIEKGNREISCRYKMGTSGACE